MARNQKFNNKARTDKRAFEEEKSLHRKNGKLDKRPVRKIESKDSKEGAVVSKEEGAHGYHNDPNWYFTNPEIARQAGELSFQSFLGVQNTFGHYTVPTVMTIHLNPSPGNTYDGSDWAQGQRSGFNMSMTKLYNRLSMKSGRNMAYAPQDVGSAVLGIGELLSMTSYMRRLFGVVKWWNIRNRMVPKQIIKAMGIDPDDFFAHFSDYRMRANTLILACNQIPILTNCGYLRKCASLYDDVFMDCDAGMAQYYIYVPFSTWFVEEMEDQRGTKLTTQNVCRAEMGAHAVTVRTFEQFLTQIMQPMVEKLLTSSTLNLVYADILNLNKTEDLQLASLDIISEEYAVVPTHDSLTLKQIHNMVAMGEPCGEAESATRTYRNDVVPNPSENCMKYLPAFLLGSRSYGTIDPDNGLGDLRIIDTDNSNPELAEKIEVTRYTSTHTAATETLSGVLWTKWDPIPDHYVVHFTIYTNEVDDSHAFTFTNDWEGIYDMTALQKAMLSQFDWAPIIYHYDTSGSIAATDWVLADLNSFTIIKPRYLQRLNSIIYMDLFEFR